MKVLYLTHYSDLYGANRSLLEMVENLRNKYDIEPIVISPEHGKINVELNNLRIENYSYKYFQWTVPKHNLFFKSLIKKYRKKIRNRKAINNILNLIQDKQIDLIHTNASTIDIGAEIAKIKNIPHVWHIREYGDEDYNLKFLIPVSKAIKYIESNSSKIVFISESVRDKYLPLIKNKEKYTVIWLCKVNMKK